MASEAHAAPLLRLLLAAVVAAALSAADPGRPSLDTAAGPEYFSSADLVWSWRAAASPALDPLAPTKWFQGAYIGNGLLGAIVTAIADPASNATPSLRIDISRTDIWDCSQREPTAFLTLTPTAAALAHVGARLELLTARLFVNMTLANGDVVSFRLLINAADPQGATGVFALAVMAPTGGSAPLRVELTPDTSGPCSDKKPVTGSAGGVLYALQSFSSGSATVAYTSFNDAALQQTVVLAVANSQRSSSPNSSLAAALASVAAGTALTVEGLEAASAAWWASFWQTSFFAFDSAGRPGVTKLEQFAHIAGYRYASAARFTMHDLMGPWGPSHATTCIGPWCQYCWDMNQQVMMYLPTPSNRGVLLGKPAFDMLPFALNGSWGAHFGSNAPGGTDNLLWMVAQVHRYCLYHGDDARLLAFVLPALRTYLQQSGLKNGTDGLLHVQDCTSPEYPMQPKTDCNYALSIYKWAAQTGLALALELAPQDPGLPLFRDVAARIAPFPVDPVSGSFEVAAGFPFAVPHRHYSHLLMLYDLNIVGAAAGDVATMGASLDVWWRITCSGPQAHGPDYDNDDECRGFTQAAMAAMSNLLNRTDSALGNLTSFLTLVGLPNAMYGEEVYAGNPDQFSPVAESAYSAAASTYGMLLQSSPWPPAPQSGSASSARPFLRLWPAAPFGNASFFRLRAEGALLVSAVRLKGATVWAAIEADLLADGSGAGASVQFTLFCPDWVTATALTVVSGSGVFAARVQPGAFSITGLVRGAAAAFLVDGSSVPENFVVGVPAGRNETEFNYWGSTFVYRGELP